MDHEIRLDGCKVLNDIEWINFVEGGDKEKIKKIFKQISDKKINLLFVTYIKEKEIYINIGVESKIAPTVIELIRGFQIRDINATEAVILSIFPHKNDPKIIGTILSIYNNDKTIFTMSFSAISIIFSKWMLKKNIDLLLKHFAFKREIEDWRLVQREKRGIYKEVVASYQEKRPKVYFLEYRDLQRLIKTKINNTELKYIGQNLIKFDKKATLTFLASSPLLEEKGLLFISASSFDLRNNLNKTNIKVCSNMAVFSMNGPHFGDRYGIVARLFRAINNASSEVIGLSCSIHSIIGVLPLYYLDRTIRSICTHFDVPSIIKR